MRGKGKLLGLFSVRTRITPAYAGKKHGIITQVYVVGDHPRLCGEKKEHDLPFEGDEGSPPPMRGKVCLVHVYKCALRITPAYAGKS